MLKGASKTQTLEHVRAVDYSRIVCGILANVIGKAPCPKSCVKTRTTSTTTS
jgi:hypothetical protein